MPARGTLHPNNAGTRPVLFGTIVRQPIYALRSGGPPQGRFRAPEQPPPTAEQLLVTATPVQESTDEEEVIDLTGDETPHLERSLHAALTETIADVENIMLKVDYAKAVHKALQFIVMPQVNGGWPSRQLVQSTCVACCEQTEVLQLRCGAPQGPRHAPYCVTCATQHVIKTAFVNGDLAEVKCPFCRVPWQMLGDVNTLTYQPH